MAKKRDWESMQTMSARLLEERTGENVAAWNRRIKKERLDDEQSLRAWLSKHGVIGYAQSLLVMERFGYPDFLTATADELIDGQYADRPQLRPIFDAVIEAAARIGDVTIQARKTYISLVSPRRTFAGADDERPGQSRPARRRSEARRTTATFEHSRDDDDSNRPRFSEGSRCRSRALAATGVSRERVNGPCGISRVKRESRSV